MEAHAVIEVRFYTTEEGGRSKAVVGNYRDRYCGAVLLNAENGFTCCLMLEGQVLELGVTYRLKVQFIAPEFVRSLVAVGDTFRYFEARDVADCRLIEYLD